MLMAELDRINALRRRHGELETAIETEKHRPLPDQKTLADLKKRKLHLKDEIEHLTQH
jgi:hypothetical protein